MAARVRDLAKGYDAQRAADRRKRRRGLGPPSGRPSAGRRRRSGRPTMKSPSRSRRAQDGVGVGDHDRSRSCAARVELAANRAGGRCRAPRRPAAPSADVRDHEQLVDLRLERRERLGELGRLPVRATIAETFTPAPAGRPRPCGGPSPPEKSLARSIPAAEAVAPERRRRSEVAVLGVHRRPPRARRPGAATTRAARHCLEDGQPEASKRGQDERRSPR